MGCASTWRPPEAGVRQGSGITGSRRWDVLGYRRDRRDGAGTSTEITVRQWGE